MVDEYKKVIDDFISNPIDWHKNPNHPIHKHEVMYFGMMAKEILALRKENKTLQKTIDDQHETTISDLKLIGRLQQENKDWAESAEISNGRIRQLRKFNDALDKENDNLKNIITELQIKNKAQ